MATFKFNCPQCGQAVETDEDNRGQVAECPHCGKGIVVPRGTSRLGVRRRVEGTFQQTSTQAAFPYRRQPVPLQNNNGLQAVCPQCGAQYEVDRKDLNRSITCGTCGNRFVVGASNTLREDAASAFRVYGTIPEWRYFVAWLAYSAAALLANAVFGGLLGFGLFILGVGGVGGPWQLCLWCFVFGMFVSMPIGYFTFRYIAITIIKGGK